MIEEKEQSEKSRIEAKEEEEKEKKKKNDKRRTNKETDNKSKKRKTKTTKPNEKNERKLQENGKKRHQTGSDVTPLTLNPEVTSASGSLCFRVRLGRRITQPHPCQVTVRCRR